jgi:hypothetical protein
MSSVVISGDTSGAITVAAPAVAGTNTLTLQAGTGTNSMNTLATAVTASGTSVDFTGLPAWVKRITVMFNAVSGSGTSNLLIQLGDSGGIETTGYSSAASQLSTAATTTASTAGFIITASNSGVSVHNGISIISLLSGNLWTQGGNLYNTQLATNVSAGAKTLSDVLDRVRITTVNGTDTFDAGTINILYEG